MIRLEVLLPDHPQDVISQDCQLQYQFIGLKFAGRQPFQIHIGGTSLPGPPGTGQACLSIMVLIPRSLLRPEFYRFSKYTILINDLTISEPDLMGELEKTADCYTQVAAIYHKLNFTKKEENALAALRALQA